MAQYRIPKNITTEMRLYKWLYLTDLFVWIGLILFGWVMNAFVHESRTWLFYGFLVVVGGVIVIRPHTNPKKRMYEAVLMAVKRRKDTYTAIDYVVEEEGDDHGNSQRT